ncbi:MAG: hypothetical protein JSR82_01455 [Verrucomicrobia bacterium]|nr:hypothetical protein [Verrucomicrobiota bacterium]
MDLRTKLLLTFLVPAFVSGVCALLAAGRPAKDAPTAAFRTGLGMMVGFWLGWAIANAAGATGGYGEAAAPAFDWGKLLTLQGVPWLPREATHWLIWLPAGAALAALCFAYMTEGGGRVLLMVILVTAFSIPMIRPLWQNSPPIQAVWVTGLVLALGVLVWAMVARLGREAHPATTAFWCTTLLSVTAGTAAATGGASLGQHAGIYAAVLGPLVLVGWWRPNAGVFGIAPPLTALALLGVLINAHFYSYLPLLGALLLVGSPVLTWALIRFTPGEGVAAGWVKALIGLLPALLAIGLAVRKAMADAGEQSW